MTFDLTRQKAVDYGVSLSRPIYAAFFLGQGGYAFSMPFAAIAEKAKGGGIDVDVFSYSDISRAKTLLGLRRDRRAVIGYSLGVTTATYLQTFISVDLLISVAASTLGENHIINHTNTKRSVLYRGTDFLSSAGLHDGYDEVVNVGAGFGIPVASHLLIPTNPIVINGVLAELAKLKAP
jgi:hypothetical protein